MPGPDAFARRVREDVARGADVIKLCVTGWVAGAFEPAAVRDLGQRAGRHHSGSARGGEARDRPRDQRGRYACRSAREFGHLVRLGMTPLEAIRAATLNAA
ncbi:MAG: hypothetical protein ACREMW_05465 [Gemmatimonadales bacterium]